MIIKFANKKELSDVCTKRISTLNQQLEISKNNSDTTAIESLKAAIKDIREIKKASKSKYNLDIYLEEDDMFILNLMPSDLEDGSELIDE